MRDLPLLVRELGRARYLDTWRAMQAFTDQRGADTPDELWVLEHEPVFTLGMNADPAHLLAPGDIPVVQVDRGGQVTYHGPGQLVVYPLIDLRRAGLGVRDLVTALEQAVIATAAGFGIVAATGRVPRGSMSRAPNWRASVYGSAAGRVIMVSRSTSTWISAHSAGSTPAASKGWR
jgi:lipoate-protein ligase B